MAEAELASTRVVVNTDAVYSANASGTAIKGEATFQYAPVPISLSAGSGILNLNYMNGALGFGSGRIDFKTNVGPRWDVFAQGTLAAFPSTPSTQAQYFNTLNVGATWAIIPDDGTRMFRVGLQDTGRTSEVPSGTTLDQLYDSVSGGAAFGYRRLTAYALGRLLISPYNPTQQYWSAIIRPFPEELRLGARVDIDRGNEVGAELEVSDFERGGRLVFNIVTLPLPTEIALTIRNTSRTFGGATEFGTVVAMRLDRGSVKSKLRAGIEAGGTSLSASQNYHIHSLNSGAVAQYLYGRGRLSPSELVQRLNPGARIIDTETVNVGGTPQVVVNYILNGARHSLTVATRESALTGARSELGEQAYGVLEDLFSSGSLEEFARRYANRSLDDKIYAAATIAQAAHAGYDTVLENASPFASAKQRLAALDPETEFNRLRDSLLGGKTLKMGICVNIDGMAAAFLRKTGVEAYTFIVGSGEGLHAIAGAVSGDGKTGYAISYGSVYKTENGGVWPAIQAYSRANGIILIGSLVFGEGNKLVGYYRGPEGRLLETVQDSGDDAFINLLTRRKR